MPITFDHRTMPQRVVFQSGAAVANAAAQVAELGVERVFLISDRFAEEIATQLSCLVDIVAHVDDIVQHVPREDVDAATAMAEQAHAEVIVSIGGGSSTGLAKAVALTTKLPIIALPTTFAGSEATDVWGITENSRKVTGADRVVLPKVVVYDATLLAGLPAGLAIASGLNAVAHAVDSYWAPRADPINGAFGTEALRALIPGIRGLHRNPDDVDAREHTLYGSYLAAVAFASAGSGMHHKICHVLGGRFGLSHAEMHAVVLRYVTAFNVGAAPNAAERLRAAFGTSPADALFQFGRELNATRSLRELGLDEADLSEAAQLCLPAIPESNPRPVTLADLEHILALAWAGAPIKELQS